MNAPECLRRRPRLAIGAFLLVVTLALYLPITRDEFIEFDDQGYITNNPQVTPGVTWPGIVWAFHSFEQGNWHPLTWISHMVDCQLFGVNPAGHHLVNALFHAMNTLLVFLVLGRLTGRLWPSALVAALFGWHPLHVESVAWASERKDVLCAFFWLLTLLAYERFARRRTAAAYGLTGLLFACALMAKPMAVTLPGVLLLLDFWPLQRWLPPATLAAGSVNWRQAARRALGLVLEKLPFFLMAAAAAGVALAAQQRAGAVMSGAALPFSLRLGNALWSCLRYLSNTICPAGLSVIYPYPAHLSAGCVAVSAVWLVVWTGMFLLWWRRFPYALTGWLWFLGTLLPVIGLVQIGAQSMADRYLYLPGLGLFIPLAWGLADFVQARPRSRPLVVTLTSAALAACLALTSRQILYWLNTVTLFSHAVQVTGDNGVADYCLARGCLDRNETGPARLLLEKSTASTPRYYPAQFSLGSLLLAQGDLAGARAHWRQAEQLDGQNPDVEYAIGMTLAKSGRVAEGAGHLQNAVQFAPDRAQFHAALGWAWSSLSNPAAALPELRRALALAPGDTYAANCLAATLMTAGRTNEALAQYAALAASQPLDPAAHYNLGLARLEAGQNAAAAAEFTAELRLAPSELRGHYRLAQALAAQSQWAAARTEYQQALRLQPRFAAAQKELAALLAAHPAAP